MSEQQSSYRGIFKSIGLFGGVQVFTILSGIIRTKFVAVLLGTTGMGLMGMLNSPLGFITTLTGLGIAFSAVRDIAAASETGNEQYIARTIVTFRRWVWLTGMLGMFVTFLLAPWLSQWAFGHEEHATSFRWLSVTLLLSALSSGQNALLQGLRKLKSMAKSSVIGTLIGLLCAVPTYHLYGMEGIVPVFLMVSASSLVLSWYFSRKIAVAPVYVSYRQSYRDGRQMARLGFMMVLTGLVSSGTAYLMNLFISQTAGIEQVGLYNAGWALVGQYVGIVFTAMATDYYPRLAGVQHDHTKIRRMVNQQAEMSLLIMSPILIGLILSMHLIIKTLYTAEFLPIVSFANLSVLGFLLKAPSWTMGFILLAKGNSKLYFIVETVASIFSLISNIVAYHLGGLDGVGISFLINYLFYSALVYVVCHRLYEFYFHKTVYLIILYSMAIVSLALCAYYLLDGWHFVAVGGAFLIMASTVSLYLLDRRMNLLGPLRITLSKIISR